MPNKAVEKNQIPSNKDIFQFHHDFVAFNEYCSFLCDAFACLLYEAIDNEPNKDTLMGAQRHCSWLRQRSDELTQELNRICEKE